MASYPSAIYPVPSFGTNMSDTKTHTTWRDEITAEVRAIEIELGTTPSGAYSTVKDHLAAAVVNTGDTMTGSLLVDGALVRVGRDAAHEQFQAISTDASGNASVGFYGLATDISTIGTRSGFVGYAGSTSQLRIQNEASTGQTLVSADGAVVLRSGSQTERMRLDSALLLVGKTASALGTAGVEIHANGSSVTGSIRSTTDAASTQNLHLRHVSSANASGELYLQFAEGAGTAVGSVTQEGTGIGVTSASNLILGASNAERARLTSSLLLVGKTASSLTTNGIELQTVGRAASTTTTASTTNLLCQHESSANATGENFAQFVANSSTVGAITQQGTDGIGVHATNNLLLFSSGAETARVTGSIVLVGKTSSGTANTGCEVQGDGQLFSTVDADITNLTANKTGSAVVSGAKYATWLLSGSEIGSITRNAATSAVLYNTSSDARRKTDVGLDDGDGLATIERISVRRFYVDDAETSSLGVYAQELHDVVPNAVTPGGDDPHTDPWQVAYGSPDLVMNLVLAVQELSVRVAELEAA